ncbi:MAG TPA: SRPBCC domain-containing protein [Bauldia sp.]|nr:SRPBCC domain-containing protein [Bauldia sp.]
MNETSTETRSIVVEREMPHPPEKVWRALTEPHLIAEWFMENDFQPIVNRRFRVSAEWGPVECQVRIVEPNKALSYTWDTKDLRSVITWTLTATSKGTRLRMEQSGFRPDQQPYHRGATQRWPQFLAALEQVLARVD